MGYPAAQEANLALPCCVVTEEALKDLPGEAGPCGL